MHTSSTDRRHFVIVGLAIAVSTILMGLLLRVALPLPPKASTQSVSIDQVIHIHLWLIAFFFSLVMVFMVYSLWAFRKRKGDESEGEHFEGNTTLEIVWTAVPLVIVLILGFIGWRSFKEITAIPENELVVQVTGMQWNWQFAYDNGTSGGELVLPVDQPARMEMVAADVLHSFWVPEFRVKQDLVPGRTTTLHFTPTIIGEYKVRCAEICGLNHWSMENKVRIVSKEEFARWMDEQFAQQNPGVAQPNQQVDVTN